MTTAGAATDAPPPSCPLCGAANRPFAEAHGRRYRRCDGCLATVLDPRDRLAADEERARYATHENDPADARYRAFLDRLGQPLVDRLPAGAEGLDYGSGPGPTLSVMLAERGFPTDIWDPFFAPDPAPLERTWDFVTCTETVEHFFEPGFEFERLFQLLRPGGILAVMTQPLLDDTDFADWWYVRDPTHVTFFRPETFAWIESHWDWTLEQAAPSVFLFRRARPVVETG